MKRILILGQKEKEALASLMEYAKKNPYTVDMMLDLMNGVPAPGDDANYVRIIPDGYKVVYTVDVFKVDGEPLTNLADRMHHVSISVEKRIDMRNNLPSVESVEAILQAMGILEADQHIPDAISSGLLLHIEDNGSGQSVNVRKPIYSHGN